MNVTIIGTGFVGIVSVGVFARHGHDMIGLDIDAEKVASLNAGEVPIHEPGLAELLTEGREAGRIEFTTDYLSAINDADVIMIAVGTPSNPDGSANLRYVFAAADSLAPHLKQDAIVAVKSTVPPGSLEQVRAIIEKTTDVDFTMASLPEFLREGTAVDDALYPDRVVIGAETEVAAKKLQKLHDGFDATQVVVNPRSAQMGKYAANAYLAQRIVFINQIADICERSGADVEEVISVIGNDERIGTHYWYPGPGYGGSCFPKDVKELSVHAKKLGLDNTLFERVNELNESRIPMLLDSYEELVGGWKGKNVSILGLSFKPDTNDMRHAPSVSIIPQLLDEGAEITAFDPEALDSVEHFIEPHDNLQYTADISQAIADADVVFALIEWDEIVEFDYSSVTPAAENVDMPYFFDTRNQFDAESIEAAGYRYRGIGHSDITTETE